VAFGKHYSSIAEYLTKSRWIWLTTVNSLLLIPCAGWLSGSKRNPLQNTGYLPIRWNSPAYSGELLMPNRFRPCHLYGAAAAQSFQPDVNFFSPDRQWYGMAAAGVKLKMPLLDGFRVHNKAMGLRIEEQKLDEDRRQLAAGKRLEYSVARTQLVNALQALRTQSDNVALAQEITDKLLLRPRRGWHRSPTCSMPRRRFPKAVTNYWQQAFGYKLSGAETPQRRRKT
jgi:hypothetical protein